MNDTARALAFGRDTGGRFVEELRQLVRFPSVSSQPDRAADVRRCAGWLAAQLHAIGLEGVRTISSAHHPIVYAEWLRARDRPTVLVYGHYDVQPVGPLGRWRTPPFGAAIVGDDLVGRGSSDDKGQLFAHVKAIESRLRTSGRLPVNVRCVFEGEEEIGSPGLTVLLRERPTLFAADVALVSDTRMLGPNRPAFTYSLRGLLALELIVGGPVHEVHSGHLGGAVADPLRALCELVAGLHDRRGRVAIPGFYEHVRDVPARERAVMARDGPSDARMLQAAGVSSGSGEIGFTAYERATIRPALTITDIESGHAGTGVKAAVPTRATAELDFRLVPDQDPARIGRLVREHLARRAPASVRLTVRTRTCADPVVVSPRHPAVQAAALAYRRGFGVPPVFLRSGGSIPVVAALQRRLGIVPVLMGFALPSDRMHAPNEKLHLPTFHRGIATSIWFMEEVGRR